MSDRVCVVAGVGPGNGTAFTKKFVAEGYRVAMLARSEDRLRDLEKEVAGATGYAIDIGDRDQVRETISLAPRSRLHCGSVPPRSSEPYRLE